MLRLIFKYNLERNGKNDGNYMYVYVTLVSSVTHTNTNDRYTQCDDERNIVVYDIAMSYNN